MPWPGHTARYALPEIYEAIKAHKTTLLFVNTRWQAELLFQELWRVNDERCRSRCIMARSTAASGARSRRRWRTGKLRAVVATSTLDLGIDWGDVDLVMHVGAPKGASRLAQRIGRANHRMDEPSKGDAGALQPLRGAGMPRGARRELSRRPGHAAAPAGTLDVLCQHILGMAVRRAVRRRRALRRDHVGAEPYRDLAWETFERAVDFVATGGYALRTYERYAKIRPGARTGSGRSPIRASRSNTG